MRQSYDYVIVGTGAAGSTLAYSLPRTASILFVDIAEYGVERSYKSAPPPYIEQAPDHYTPGFSGVLGGNTALWAGKIYLIAPQEMADWPIHFKDLECHSRSLASELGIPHSWIANRRGHIGDSFFHTSYRSNLGNLYEYFNLDHFPNVSVLERHNLVSITEERGRIRSVSLSSVHGEKREVRVEHSVILAAGALGNTQLLLNLLEPERERSPREAYGRLRDHPHFNVGRVKRIDPLESIMKGYLRVDPLGEADALEDCLVTSGGVGFVAAQIDGPKEATWRLKRALYGARAGFVKTLLAYTDYILRELWSAFSILRGAGYSVQLFFSQDHNEDNIVTLSEKRDSFGLYKININHRIVPGELVVHQDRLRALLGKNAKGLNLERLREKHVNTGLHPSCTTPIGDSGEYGTLDTDLRVNGYDNLYSVGSNVFPTNGITNPTWTIMVFARRLAAHLYNHGVNPLSP